MRPTEGNQDQGQPEPAHRGGQDEQGRSGPQHGDGEIPTQKHPRELVGDLIGMQLVEKSGLFAVVGDKVTKSTAIMVDQQVVAPLGEARRGKT
jgi:hypothetical protein